MSVTDLSEYRKQRKRRSDGMSIAVDAAGTLEIVTTGPIARRWPIDRAEKFARTILAKCAEARKRSSP